MEIILKPAIIASNLSFISQIGINKRSQHDLNAKNFLGNEDVCGEGVIIKLSKLIKNRLLIK